MSDYEEDTTCPLCMDPLDATDQAINFCQCGYKMCLWCWNQLMETASREALPGRCPNCRTEYDKGKITMAQLDPDVVQREQQRRKEQSKKKVTADTLHRPPRSLGQVRVVQRNLVYAVGMPLSICREEVLADRHYFGQFGRIKKVSVNRSTPFSQVQKNGPSGSAYVTFYRPEDALRCIEAVDGSVWDGKTIKACFGTTKYCNAFLKGVPCNNPDCLYLHDVAAPGDSFSKDDMMANGLQSGRNTFFDLVHPTSTKEASAHAHAALQSMSSDSSGAGSSGGAVGSSTAVPAAASRAASQPMAITGVRRTSNSTPWGSGGGDGPATASPSKPGAAAMAAAAAARWGSLPRPTPPSAVPLNSPLADVDWPSLGAAADAADAQKHVAADNSHGTAVQTVSSSGKSTAGPHPQHPSASASAHPVSHPVGQTPAAAAAPTAAAVVAGKVPAATAAAAAAAVKQQQQGGKQQLQQHKAMVSLTKTAKTPANASLTTGAAPVTPPPTAPPAAKGKQAKAAAAAAPQPLGEVGAAAMEAQQQQSASKDSKSVTAAAPPAVAVVAESATTSASKATQANGKLTKQEAKKAAKAAAKQAAKEAAEEEAAKAKAVQEEAAAAANPEKGSPAGKAADANGAAGSPVKGSRHAAAAAVAVATPSLAAKVPPPGFAGATPGRVKGPPPGFQAAAAGAQQRPPPPGFEPALLALARAGSSTSLSGTAQGSSGGGAPPGMAAAATAASGMSPLGIIAAAGAAAIAGSASGTASPAVAASANGGGMGSRRSSDLDGAAAGAISEELALSTGTASRPQSRAGSVHGAAAAGTPAKPAISDAAAAAPNPIFSPPLVAPPQQQQQQSLFGAPGSLSPLLGFQTHAAPQQLFGTPAAVSSSSAFDVNAFFDPVGPYAGSASGGAAGSVGAGGSLFGGSLGGAPSAHSPLAAATPVAGGIGGAVTSSADGAVPLSTRKQSRFSFAQQPAQQQTSAPAMQQQLQPPGARAPPGFAGFGVPAAVAAAGPTAAASAHTPPGGLGGDFGGGAFAGRQAASFFKNLLPGVNVHVAGSPPTPAAGVMGYPPGVAGVAPFPIQAAPAAAAPNPGLALLQQLQRGCQQH